MRTKQGLLATLLVSGLAACGGSEPSPASASASTPPPGAPTGASSVTLPAAPALPLVRVPSEASTFDCRNVRVDAQSIDTVFVPAGATCVLDGTRLIGSIKVDNGATLDARRVRMNGNVQAESAANVILADSIVGGSVQLKQGGAATVAGAQITGDLQLFTNRGLLLAQENRVGGSIQVDENTGGVRLDSNLINGNLQCKQNQPAPTGGNNRAALKQDQCASL